MNLPVASYIDHTMLKPDMLLADADRLCNEAIQYGFAAVCVPPPFVKYCKPKLVNAGVKLATVIGFPFGYSAVEAKIAEIMLAVVDGADELDMVINITALKNNDWQYLANEIGHVLPLTKNKNKTLKIIIETGLLTDEEIIKCCELYGITGVDYLKTSTGYASTGATVHAVGLMRAHLPESVKIKASGGIKSYSFARQLIDAGADRLGCSSSVQIVQEMISAN
ncbi:MAG: deoxyribose-phosphate aldolase [Ferruginibacter sp.]